MDAPIRYARNGDVSIAYATMGEGPIDLIFVPGFVSHLEILHEYPQARRFLERLASFSRLICFDKRGTGLSDRGVPYTIEAVTEDMLAVLDAAGSSQAAVFGVSEGGSAATMFAASHPARARSLVQFGTYARITAAEDFPEGIPVDRMRAFTGSLVEHWEAPPLTGWAPSLATDREALHWWARLLRNGTSPSGANALWALYEEIDVRPLLPLVRVPSLILWREGDRVVPRRLSRAVADGIPEARAVELPGSDHLPMAGDQEAVLGEIEEFLTGERSGPPVERALATVLFTDIVGSTERAAREGDAAWRRLLDEHDRIVRAEVAGQRGTYVKSTGDGALATFDGPARAIAAAGRMGDTLDRLGLPIRSGVHTGECEHIGADVGGIAVHIGARVSSEAGPGEILVSQTVRDLVVGSGIEFEDRGVRELKGVPGDWRLFAVAGRTPAAIAN
ncbi:MAG: adenylate/guanylate cyclase domain-containing protein [Solirubrobacterales bacterium]